MKRNVGELQICGLSKFQLCTTLGAQKNTEKLKNQNNAKNIRFFHYFVEFLRRYAETDVTDRFLALFCFRYTYYQICTTKFHQQNGSF